MSSSMISARAFRLASPSFPPAGRALTALGVLGLLAACNAGSSTAPRASAPVQFSLAARTSSASATAGAATITGLRLAVGELSLGNGSQYGCQDCQDNSVDGPEGTETHNASQIVTVPLNGGPVQLATEAVQPGRYAQAQIELTPRATTAGWTPGATIEIAGTYAGTPFTLALPVAGTFNQTLAPPVDVTTASAGSPVSVTITLPVSAWFTGPNGVALDPTNPAARAQIEANVRATLQAGEAGEGAETVGGEG